MKAVAKIFAVILIFFGVLFIWGAFSTNTENQIGSLITGIVTAGIGLTVIWFANRKMAEAGEQKVTLDIDLSGEVDLEKFQCEQCGGNLSAKNVRMLAGAPTVECPYCGAVYQITEKPKW
ncbi:MAG: hypothetical protein DWG76_05495 [Chloroflexi bacterium]|nr:hypothetical protein [Chloroflexota bacterium]MQC26885.1 hypothetical protein [Chloroflexota bacterium]